jgi:hypothetical protein
LVLAKTKIQPLELLTKKLLQKTHFAHDTFLMPYNTKIYKPDFKNPVEHEENVHPSEVDASTRALADFALVLFNSNEFVYLY